MKTFTPSSINNAGTILFALIVLSTGSFCQAQSASALGQQAAGDYAITKVGPHSRVWGNSAGQTVTEIQTGMNYWSGQKWTPSNPSFQISADGTAFVADQIQDPTQLAANLNCVGAVTVTTPDNVTLRSTPTAIGLYDAASGKSVIVATLTNCTGVLTDPQDVVYDRAFVGGGFAASVVYSLPDTASFHQDIVFVGFNPTFNPTNWGFAETSTNSLQIQIFTEFYGPPQPLMLTNLIYAEQDQAKRASMASPDLFDYTLDFGHYVFGPGRAYTMTTNNSASGGMSVAKEFVTSNGRTFLIESIPYRWLASELQALPPVVARTSSLKRPSGARKTRVAAASLAPLRDIKPGSVEKIKSVRTIAMSVTKPRGVDIDYVVTVSSTVEPTLYASDTTYFVSGTVVESSPVTMESAVFKYPSGGVGTIEIENTLTMVTTNYRPAVFTSADDNTAGATLSTSIWSGYTGTPHGYYGEYALWLNTTAVALNNVRFCYMNDAIEITAAPYDPVVTLSHAQLVNCSTGINVIGEEDAGGYPLTVNVNNCLMGKVLYPFTGSFYIALTGSARNCTIDSCTDLISMNKTSGSFGFTNSIFSSISSNGILGSLSLSGSSNGFYSATSFGSSYMTVYTSPYQSNGAGYYYLPSSSPFLNRGTTNIGSVLLSQLQAKTTQAPLTLTEVFTNDAVLTPIVPRDTTGNTFGFHYDPIDYITACSVSNATLFLINGVTLAYYDNLGIWLQDGGQLVSQGSPNSRNYLAYYGQVQEQPVNLWGVTNALAQALPIAPLPFGSSANPSIFLRLTTICAPAGETNLLNTGDSNQVISGLTLRDCEVYGSGANWVMNESNNTPVIGLTNNVFYRVPFAVSNNATITSYNNLFYGTTNTPGNLTNTTVSIRYRGANSPNTNENNVFDGVKASLDGLVGYNAYLHGGTNSAITNNSFWTNLTWLAGPLGAYYQATNGPLINKGSTSASNLDLYHYTVTTNLMGGFEIKETNSTVDLGYHYVAVNSNGIPISTNGQGVPDYLAGVSSSGISNSWLMQYFGTLDVNTNVSYDGSGLTVYQDYQGGDDPNVIAFNLTVTNQYVKSSSLPAQTTVTAGMASYMASLVDSTNWASAVWTPYNPSMIVPLGFSQGWHQVWVGLRGLPSVGQQTWACYRVNLQTTPPVLVVTNPVSTNLMQPIMEVQGYCAKPLASLTYSVSNAAGLLTNQQAVVLSQHFDTNTVSFTTNTFQAFDVPLTNGANLLTFTAADLAGNVTTTNFSYMLSYASKTNPPAIQVYWPQNGDVVSGSVFTLRGVLGDFTASLTAQIVDSSGNTNIIPGLVERNGLFWVENAPLLAGTNHVTLTGMDVVSNIATTNLTVICVNPGLTIDDFSGQLGGTQRNVLPSVTGTVSLSGYTLWVNGVKATQSSGTWEADSVPVGPGGTAVVEVRAIPNSDNGGNGTGTVPPTDGTPSNPTGAGSVAAQTQIDQPAICYLQDYHYSWNSTASEPHDPECPYTETDVNIGKVDSDYFNGGTASSYISQSTSGCGGPSSGWQNYAYSWPASQSPVTNVYTDSSNNTNITTTDLTSALDYAQGESYLGDTLLLAEWSLTEHVTGQSSIGSSESDDTGSICSQMELQTGGKGIPGAQSLFEINVAATSYTSRITEDGVWTPYWNTQAIPPAQITVLGQSPGSDGTLPVLLADNVSANITPQTPSARYFYSISESQYPLTLKANDYDLSQTNPTFCVGQQITFSVNLIGLAMTNVYCSWTLGGSFVNSATTNLAGCISYTNSASLLSGWSNTCQCWYYNSASGSVSVKANIIIDNVILHTTAVGKFSIYRPSLVSFQPPLGGVAAFLYETSGQWHLAVGDVLQDQAMNYSVYVNSEFSGKAGITQVFDDESVPVADGYNNLDYVMWYPNPHTNLTTINTNFSSANQIGLTDYPWELCNSSKSSTTTLVLQFRDYARFRPDAGNVSSNLFVTLGKITWNVNADATLISNVWTFDTNSSVTGPTLDASSVEWPFWTNVAVP